MEKDRKSKGRGSKALVKLVLVWVLPMLFVAISGALYVKESFQGTFVQQLYPSIFCGGYLFSVLTNVTMQYIDNHDICGEISTLKYLIGETIAFVVATALHFVGLEKVLVIVAVLWILVMFVWRFFTDFKIL